MNTAELADLVEQLVDRGLLVDVHVTESGAVLEVRGAPAGEPASDAIPPADLRSLPPPPPAAAAEKRAAGGAVKEGRMCPECGTKASVCGRPHVAGGAWCKVLARHRAKKAGAGAAGGPEAA